MPNEHLVYDFPIYKKTSNTGKAIETVPPVIPDSGTTKPVDNPKSDSIFDSLDKFFGFK